MARIPQEIIDEVVEKSDIEDVVGRYVSLTKRTGANRFGLCPFHGEKTPSFSVNTSKQIYYCFGCHNGGGAIKFIMEMEHLEFQDAVRKLAADVGVTIPEDKEDIDRATRRQRLLELNKEAARWFHETLMKSPGAGAGRDYVRQRGISGEMVTRFGLGFAPDAWDTLAKAMKAKGYTDEELFAAGLAARGNRGDTYDKFRNRLMFPIIDVRGSVIGFSGRLLSGEGAKYMNSPETEVYRKKENLFALNLAKKSKSKYIILVEGNVDVVSLHQAGFDSAVAPLGTALTPEQIQLLAKYAEGKELVLCYDSDGAGQNATEKAMKLLNGSGLGLKVRILRLPGAKDPDEFLRSQGKAAFQNLLEGSQSDLDYQLKTLSEKYDLTADSGRADFARAGIDWLCRISDRVKQEIYAGRVAELAGVSKDAVISEARRRRERLLKDAKKKETTGARPGEVTVPIGEKRINLRDTASAAAEKTIIRALYADPELIRHELPAPEEFSSPELGNIYRVILNRLSGQRVPGPAALQAAVEAELEGPEVSLFTELTHEEQDTSSAAQALKDGVARLKDCRQKQSMKENLSDEDLLKRIAGRRQRETSGGQI